MRTTRYNSKVTIQTATEVENEIGGWSNTWEDHFTSWASVIPIRGIKRLEYAKLSYVESYEVEMRQRRSKDLDGDCRVIYAGNAYQIISIMRQDGKINMDIGRDGQ